MQKEADLLLKAAQQDALYTNNQGNNTNSSNRPSTVPSSSSSSTMVGVGSGASAVRAMSARNRGVSTSGTTTGPVSSSQGMHSSNGPLQSSRKYSVNSLMTNSIDGRGSSVNGGSQLGMSLSFSVAGSSAMVGHLNVNHPPGIYRTNFILPGGDRGGTVPGSSNGGKVDRSGMLVSSSSVSRSNNNPDTRSSMRGSNVSNTNTSKR